jgi:lactoylglutathione lyase
MRRVRFVTCCLFVILGSSLMAQNKMRINHLAIYVTDLKQSREFYVKVLGLDSIPEPFHDGKHLWLDLGFGASLHIIAGADKKIEHFLNNHMCLSTRDFTAFKNILEQRKIAYHNAGGEKGKITTRTDGVLQLWLQDPDGYWIEINNDKRTLGVK